MSHHNSHSTKSDEVATPSQTESVAVEPKQVETAVEAADIPQVEVVVSEDSTPILSTVGFDARYLVFI